MRGRWINEYKSILKQHNMNGNYIGRKHLYLSDGWNTNTISKTVILYFNVLLFNEFQKKTNHYYSMTANVLLRGKRNMEKFVFSMNNTSLQFWVQRQHRVLYITKYCKTLSRIKEDAKYNERWETIQKCFPCAFLNNWLSLRKCHKYSVNSFPPMFVAFWLLWKLFNLSK